MRAFVVVLLLAATGLLLAACGQSAQEKAQNQVCDARADIQKQIETLQGLPLSTASIAPAQKSLGAIGNDLTKIKAAQGDLKPQRKQQVQQAISTFGSQVGAIAKSLASGVTGGAQARSQAETALRQLSNSFAAAFKPVGC